MSDHERHGPERDRQGETHGQGDRHGQGEGRLRRIGGDGQAGGEAGGEVDPSQPGMIHIRDLSIKCGHCGTYQTLCAFSRRDEWNVYTYECENDVCDPEITRTLLEVPRHLDAFARRDPEWRGGRIHGGG